MDWKKFSQKQERGTGLATAHGGWAIDGLQKAGWKGKLWEETNDGDWSF